MRAEILSWKRVCRPAKRTVHVATHKWLNFWAGLRLARYFWACEEIAGGNSNDPNSSCTCFIVWARDLSFLSSTRQQEWWWRCSADDVLLWIELSALDLGLQLSCAFLPTRSLIRGVPLLTVDALEGRRGILAIVKDYWTTHCPFPDSCSCLEWNAGPRRLHNG